MVWGRSTKWSVLEYLLNALKDDNLGAGVLQTILADEEVVELRLLRGAAACLGPAMVQNFELHQAVANMLQALLRTLDEYL